MNRILIGLIIILLVVIALALTPSENSFEQREQHRKDATDSGIDTVRTEVSATTRKINEQLSLSAAISADVEKDSVTFGTDLHKRMHPEMYGKYRNINK